METSGKILMIGGGVLAVVVAGLVSYLLARQPATAAVLPGAHVATTAMQQDTAPVVIATRNIARGTTIHARDVSHLFALVYEPKGAVATQTVFSDPAQLSALLSVVPRQTTDTIVKGEQLSAPLLAGMALPGQGGALAARLSKGFDGETVTIAAANKAVDGAIAVNDRVDVIYSLPTMADPGAVAAQSSPGGPQSTAMLIQGATVVATYPLSNTYTLAVRPEDAVRLAHVKDAGWSLHLVLRSVFDGSGARTTRAAADTDFER